MISVKPYRGIPSAAPREKVKMNWLFNVTINDISVIHVTANRYAGGLKKKLDLRSGSPCHRYGDSDAPPHLVAFYEL